MVDTGGAERHPADTERLRQYWEHGEGAAKIAWGSPGDYDRCVVEISKYVPGMAHGMCENMHKDVLGITTAEHAKELRGGK